MVTVLWIHWGFGCDSFMLQRAAKFSAQPRSWYGMLMPELSNVDHDAAPSAAKGRTMSTIPGLERPAPVANELTKPFWDACNERRLMLQNCTACQRLHYPPAQKCSKCGAADKLTWKEVTG